MDSAFVTNYNFKRLAGFWLLPKLDIPIDEVFSLIFDRDLSEILNDNQAVQLYVQKQMLEKKLHDIRVVKKRFNNSYVFSVAPPKFHKNRDCEHLKSDFRNYLVPDEIKRLGEQKVAEFQQFCESSKSELAGKTDDIFWAHVGAKFRVHIAPKAISYDNSGIRDFDEASIDEIRDDINHRLDDALKLLVDSNKSNILRKMRYAPSVRAAISCVSDLEAKAIIENFFDLKKAITYALFELYKKQAHANDCILPVALLESCGMSSCKGCWK